MVLVLVLGATMCTQRSESRCSLAHLSQDREVEGRHVQSPDHGDHSTAHYHHRQPAHIRGVARVPDIQPNGFILRGRKVEKPTQEGRFSKWIYY